MASSSRPQVIYDVFLSFRGEDTRNGFTSHLNAALCRMKIKTFIDDGLRRGDWISSSLVEAIEGSKISIIIFSKNYASSKWCLQELVKILECKEKYGQIVIPIFYHADPSDVRKQTGSFGDALAKLEVRFQTEEEMLQGRRWRNALTEAANISGFDSNIVRLESTLIEKIIKDVLKRLNNMCSGCKNLVGVAMKVRTIKSLLSNGSSNVCKVGIWGMGGIGKTTIANAVFNEISSQFEGFYFIQNIREESEKHGPIQLQEKLLSTLLEDEHPNIRHASTIERLGRKKVLIVFDDVTHINQINELIGDLENLGAGSQIIITTRDKQVLVSCNVDHDRICEIKGLYDDESFQLFSQHAFKQNHPIDEDYMELSNQVIRYAKGVPLALKVLGSFLLNREKYEWESTLEKLKNCPNQDIQTVLKISYDGLDVEEKNLFLDIACFFNGWDECLVRIFSSSIGLRVLIDRALITITYREVRVHDLLQEMGMEIVRQESLNKLGERSRLWLDNDVYNVLNKNKVCTKKISFQLLFYTNFLVGTDKIQGVRFNMSEIRVTDLNPHAFSKMDYLRLLIVDTSKYEGKYNNVHGFEGLQSDFTELRCLFWDFYPFQSLPSKFYPQNLVVLKMRHSELKQWTGIKDLANLKLIDLSHSEHLFELPDLSEAQNLECLILEDCTSLSEIIPPTRNLNKLVNLNLRNCKSLTSLPTGLQSKSLKDVILSGCSNLETCPMIACNMEQLCLDGTAIKELSSSIESSSRLVELNLKDCLWLESLPSSVCNLESLQQLDLSGLVYLKMVPEFPRRIEELYLDRTAIEQLSSSIENASNLVRLSLKDCSSLRSLPNGLSKLKSLKYICISGCSKLHILPEDIGHLQSLEVLEATGNSKDCLGLESLPSSIHNLNLRFLNLSGLVYLKMVPEFPRRIEELYLDGTAIEQLSSSIENASNLVRLSLKDCSSLRSLPNGMSKLKSLKYICISGCSKLHILPEDIGHLQSLEVLEANGTSIGEIPSSMTGPLSPGQSGLQFLRRLNLNHCSLTQLPNNLDRISLLRELELEGNNFENLPTSIVNLSKLKLLNIRVCNRLKSLPKLPSNIEELRADNCKRLKAISGLKNLNQRHCGRKLSFPNCVSLNWNVVRDIFHDAALDLYSDEFEVFKYEKVAGKPQGVMCFPGSEIPEWFNIQSSGSVIELPQGSFNHKKFLGFVFCVIVKGQGSSNFLNVEYEFLVKCLNEYMTFDKKLLSVGPTYIKSDHDKEVRGPFGVHSRI
ncbi:disease resistance protein RPV1-like [Mangifera indica]|uniref:disease resistance protein RPV1-like n=1 Tax=Mangifera indica TaxID=29780 RepID=UPI001CFBDDE0|nr:disease resistance protein RPV1-like [Mangifera indica]